MVLITTDAVPPRERFAYWREVVSRQIVHLRPEPVGEDLFQGRISPRAIGGLGVAEVTTGRLRVFRGRAEIARSPVPVYLLGIHLGGTASFRQGADEIALSCGDIFIVDALSEFELGCEQPMRHLVVTLPKDLIASRVARPDLLPGAVVPRHHPLCRLLTTYLVNGFEIAEQLTPDAGALVAQHVVDLLAQALGESQSHAPASSGAWREAVFVRACRMIALRCGNPELAPHRMARELHISTSLLHRIFAERGETVMTRVWEERVNRAAKLLANPDTAPRSITDIAFACGFNDSAHFTRAFAARKGMAPSQWRKEAA